MASASRVVLGLGGCVDYELKLTADVLSRLAEDYGIRSAELTSPAVAGERDRALSVAASSAVAGERDLAVSVAASSAICGERDLVVSILGYVARGGGGEHFVTSAPALAAFADRFPHRATLGGTSVRAGLLMSRLGVPSTLHLVSVNDIVRRLLPPDISYISSGVDDTFYPHLIVQYDRGLRVRAGDLDITAPFPNRLIYVNDPANSDLLLTADLGTRLREASVFLISGFNAMRDRDSLDERLSSLREHMRQLPPGAVTYFEDAAYHEPTFSRRVRDALLPEIDIYGLNEDELQSYLGRPVDLLSALEVAAALTEVHALIPVPALVLHTKYWALAHTRTAPGSVRGLGRGDYTEALDAGTVMAATRYSHGDTFTGEDVDRLRHRPRRPESATFAAALRALMGDTIHCVPGFVLDVENPTTVGLGDTFVGGFLAALAQSVTPAAAPEGQAR
jgi:ADP-dependent phosphofructokinase/glucokinase